MTTTLILGGLVLAFNVGVAVGAWWASAMAARQHQEIIAAMGGQEANGARQ